MALVMVLPRNLPAQVVFQGSETIANTTTANSQQNPASAVDSAGHIFLVWESYAQDADDYGIYASVFNSDGTTLVSEFRVNSTTANGQRYPSVAADASGNFVVTWMSESQDGDGWGVYMRKYGISGTAISSEQLVNDSTSGDQKFPQVAMTASGDFVVTWMSDESGDNDVKAKNYDNTASVVAGEYLVNTYTTSYQGYPRVALRTDGYGMIVWQSLDQDGSGQGVYGQRISPSGGLIGSEFSLHTYTSGNQQEPDVAMNSQGETVVVWSSYGQDGNREGIYLRKYDSTGTALSTPSRVNSTTSGVQSHAVVSITDSSNYAVLWNSYGLDGSYDGVYMQAYSANDATFGSEALVNTRTTDFQQFADVAFTPSGFTFVAVWQDGLRNDTATHDGDDYGIYFQRLSVEDTTPPTAVCKDADVYLSTSGTGTLSVNSVNNGSSDNSGSVSLSVSPSSFICSDVGSQTVTLTVSDAAGNSSTCTATVTVYDNRVPTANCQNITVYLDGTGNATITGNDIDNGSTDNCTLASLTASVTAFTCNEVGANSVTLTATDSSGNSGTCTSTVTVLDTVTPTAACQNITVYLDGTGNTTFSASDLDNGSSDNCGSPTLTASATSFTCNEVGANSVTLTATDGSGNSNSCTSIVTVTDSTAPTAVCQNITLYLDGSGNATLTTNDLDGGSTDNCSITSASASISSFTCNDIGSVSVALTVTDPSGNATSCTSVVTVTDSMAPSAVCQSLTVYLDGLGSATITANDMDNGSSDNCSSITLTASTTSFSCNEIGANTVTLTVTDGSGNTHSCTSTVTILDSIAPTAACQNITVYLDGTGSATITANDIDNGSSDNCGSPTLSASATSFTCNEVGTNTVTLTATDGSGNTSSCSGTITILDSIAPTAVCQNITLYLDGSGNATLTTNDLDGGSTDNCSPITYVASATSFTCNDIGTNSVTLTATDPSGNSASCAAVVTVTDTVSPSAICNNATVQLDSTGNGVMGASVIGASSTDNCGILSVTVSQGTFNCGDIGMVSVTLTVTDSSGNASSCVATLTVQDITAPVVVCNNATVTLDSTGNGVIGASVIGLGTADACTTFTSTLSQSAFTCNDIGANTVTFTATDVFGNAASCTATVTVQDSIAPTAVCANPTLYLDGSGNATLSTNDLNGGSTDNCTIATVTTSNSTFNCNNIGTNPVTLTVTDGSGNASTCTGTVTILDTLAPTATCQNITVYLDGNGQATITANDVDGGSTDNCAGTVLSATPTLFDCNTLGANSVTLTATDGTGNSTSCTATVTAMDTLAPTIACQNITVYLDSLGAASITGNDIDGGTTDNCSVGSLSASTTTFSCNDVGTASVVLTATDVNGNSSTCTSTVTVIDSIAPVVACQALTLYLDGSGDALLNAGDLDNGSTDACSPLVYSASANGFGCGDIGTQTVVLTVSDPSGNAGTCTTTIVVLDSTAPAVVCNAVDVYLDANGQASLSASQVGAGTTDNCAFTESIDLTSFTCSDLGPLTVNYTATDSSGNTATCSATITVIDSLAPELVCLNDTVYLDSTGNGSTTLNQILGSQSDNCGIASTSASQLSFTTSDIGANAVTVSAVDSSGNVGTCVSTVTVIDTFATAIDPGFLAGDGLIWQAWPNPAMDQVNVEIACGSCIANGEYVLELTEMSGKVLVRQKVILNGNTAQITLDLRPYASGVMALTLKNASGSQTKRIVKM